MERTEARAVGHGIARDGQAGEAFVGELQVRARARRLAAAIEAGLEPLDEAQLADLRLERARAGGVVEGRERAQGRGTLARAGGRERGARGGARVRRLAEGEPPPVAIAKDVDARRTRQPGGERQLGG